MPRYKLTIEYDGTPFAGWQRQANAPSVQQALEEAVFAMSSETVVVHGAGRTDAGVHAIAQVAHIDLSREWRTDKIRDAMNAHLKPQPVAVLQAEAVDDTFEARFSATARHYVYRILNRRAPPTVMRDGVWHVMRRVDAEAMHEAAQVLIGKHDFSTFRAAECQANSPLRTLDKLDVVRNGDMIEIFASARSFLHHQVRSITGSLEHVGSGKWTKQDLKDALESKDRARCGMVAPPNGLYLLRVDY
ncbi:MAG: tRNA pseudouridine(38-40) synthase TruA [Rhizobiales bacterium 62-17]|nr:tRNA pseudouridine(38-40) synthase TruA [Hyphomicrobiales bacterium]OJY00985.1 MAG: tRNA pseudouridine(38-40) synthase TruA [Rhizobiales bacterium 62-17]